MDLVGLDEFLRNSNVPEECGEPNLARALSDFIPDDVNDSGNGYSSPEHAFTPEMAVPFATDSPTDMAMEGSPMGEVPTSSAGSPPLENTNPFSNVDVPGKSNPLYDSTGEPVNYGMVQSGNFGDAGMVVMSGAMGQPPLPVAIGMRQLGMGRAQPQVAAPQITTSGRGSKKKRKMVKMEEHPAVGNTFGLNIPVQFPSNGKMDTPESTKKILFVHHEPTKREMNCQLFDENYEELAITSFEVQADKGFNHSPLDDAFVCQKKNHFQVSIKVRISAAPKYVQIGNTLRPISGLFLAIWGLKDESPQSTVNIEQSHTDRTKKPFEPVQVKFENGECSATFNRLHFSETTANNMRKKGKPNPDQRYFILLVEFHVLTESESDEPAYATIHCHRSQRIIVRASNPGQFDGEVEMKWVKGKIPDSIAHFGPVGINTDRPMGALSVNGNMSVTGHIMHPSDRRVKENLQAVDTRRQMENVQALQLYDYELTEPWAKHAGRTENRSETGVIAQDLAQIIPDAVKNTKQVIELEDGSVVNDLLIVDTERIFMENVGAVQELCRMTENMDNRIKELEELQAAVKSGTFRRRRSTRRLSWKKKKQKD